MGILDTAGDFAQSNAGLGLSFLAGPVGGAIGLVGKGITGWLAAKEKEEQREEDKKIWKEKMAEDRRRFELEFDMTQKRFGLDKAQMLNNLRQQQENQDNYYDERNVQRFQGYKDNLNKLLNTGDLRNRYLEKWGA